MIRRLVREAFVSEFHCLIGDETVTVQAEAGAQRVLALSVLFAEQTGLTRTRRFLAGGGTDVIYKPNLHALAVDMKDQQAVWKPVRYLFRRAFEGTLIQLTTNDHRKITVTDLHPMLVFEESQLALRAARDVRPGDRVPLYWQGEVATIPIRETKAHDASTTVYSMEVDDTHTFASSFGIYVHNCIPPACRDRAERRKPE